MKLFEDNPVEIKQPEKPTFDNTSFIKKNLLKTVTRSQEVIDALERWLFSFDGAISKQLFNNQLKRLAYDDAMALEQINKAMGYRTIPRQPPPKQPPLQKSLLEQMLDDIFVGVTGRKFKTEIKKVIPQLRECGTLYILPIEDFIIQFKSYKDKGSAPQMIDSAIEADFLLVVGMELPIHLEWHVQEALARIARQRWEAKKPIITTWQRHNRYGAFIENFHIYEVE